MPACASTGNLAQSVAAHAAHAGMSAYVFIPADLEQAKVLATAVYAPNLIAVKGNYDDVNRLCAEIAGEYGWAFVNVNVRPYYAEGSKTLGFEIAEQLGWTLPDHVVAPMASGSMLVKIDKAFTELANLELVADTPYRISGAQATGCSPISTGLKDGTGFVKPVRPETIAKSLAIGNPADGYYAIDAVRRTGGWMEDVSDAEVIDGIQLLACTEGVFGETAAGVTIASLRKLVVQGRIEPGERTVAVVSGHGLKTPDALADPVGQRVGGLQPVAGDDRHGALPWFDAALHHQLAQRRDGDAGGGLAEDALRAGEQLDAVDHLGVGDVLHPPAGAARRRVDGGRRRRRGDRRHPAARLHGGRLRRDRRRRHHRVAAQAGGAGPHRTRGAHRGGRLRPRAEDPRRVGRPGRPDAHHHGRPGGLPGGPAARAALEAQPGRDLTPQNRHHHDAGAHQWQQPFASPHRCAPPPAAPRPSRAPPPRWASSSPTSSGSTPGSPNGCWTTPGRSGGSSTCSSTTRTSASSRGSTRRSATARPCPSSRQSPAADGAPTAVCPRRRHGNPTLASDVPGGAGPAAAGLPLGRRPRAGDQHPPCRRRRRGRVDDPGGRGARARPRRRPRLSGGDRRHRGRPHGRRPPGLRG